ncbi:hypothetical protein GE21DRAFT_1034777 [Neurospora crassa]|nr:hypothetical protein GE21DRAFT_1034777 [Neurospora crassa]
MSDHHLQTVSMIHTHISRFVICAICQISFHLFICLHVQPLQHSFCMSSPCILWTSFRSGFHVGLKKRRKGQGIVIFGIHIH